MKRHSPDLVSLVFGLVFLLVAALWPLWQLSLLDNDSITWVPATALILIGVVGLALSIARARAPRAATSDAAGLPYGADSYGIDHDELRGDEGMLRGDEDVLRGDEDGSRLDEADRA